MEVRQFDDLGYKLTTIKSDKFKTNLISVSFQSEIERDSVTKRSLLPYVMRSATKNILKRIKYVFRNLIWWFFISDS